MELFDGIWIIEFLQFRAVSGVLCGSGNGLRYREKDNDRQNPETPGENSSLQKSIPLVSHYVA